MTRSARNSIGLMVTTALLALAVTRAEAVDARPASALAQAQRAEQTAAALVSEGVSALGRGDEAGAKAAFERALKVDPKDVTAHTYLGVLADRAGRRQEAERHFAAAVAADPSSPSAHNNHGAILLSLGRAAEAAKEFEASLRLNDKQPSALVNLAQIRFATGTAEKLREARDLFERAAALAPDAEIFRALVVVSLRLNDSGRARSYYRDYVARLESAPARITDASARRELGAALMEAGLIDEAASELDRAVASDPSNVAAILLLAQAHMARKDIPAAGRTLEAAVARGATAAKIYAALADVYEASGHVENAIPAMRLAIERDPANEDYRFQYAMILTGTKAPAAAAIRLKEAIELFPRSVKLWFALGVAQSADNRSDEAARAFERALEINPKFAPALAYLGMTHAEQGNYTEAVGFYERALAIDDRLAAAHFLAADAMLSQASADAARAEAHLTRALELDATFVRARLVLAKLYMRTDRAAQAAGELERVIAAEPNLAEAHYQLGRAYSRLKRKAEADAEFATFKKLSDSQKEQAQSERRDIARRLANVRF